MSRIQVSRYYVQIIANNTDVAFMQLISQQDSIYKMRKADTYRCSIRMLPEIIVALRPGHDISEFPEEIQEYYTAEMLRRQQTNLLKELGPDQANDNYPWMWEHQLLGVELAQVNSRYNFFYDTRTGKTLMALSILFDRLKSGRAKRCLVICPSTIVQSWLDDANKHFPQLKIACFYGSEMQRYECLHTPAHVIIWATNHVAGNMPILLAAGFDTCFFDESSAVKNHSTKISAAILELSQHIPSWYNLSATPAPNNESEYYVQMRALDAYCFNPARTKFVDKYFNNTSKNRNYEKLKIKPEMYEEFMQIIEEFSIYVDQDIMPTAGKVWHVFGFPLEDELRSMYDNMCNNSYVELNGKNISADMSTAVRAKLNQIASGILLDTEAIQDNKILKKLGESGCQQESFQLSTMRIDYVRKILKTYPDEKIVIWANYKAEFAMLQQFFTDEARYLNGDSSLEYKQQAIRDFKKGSLKYLVCHPLSVGMGINLAEAHIVIYYSLNDSWEAFKQSSERIYGHITVQPNVCHYYVLQAKDTVNELIYGNLVNKREASYGLLEHLKARSLVACDKT